MSTFGTTATFRLPGAKYTIERTGLASYDVAYKDAYGIDALLEQGSRSADYPNVVLVSGSIIHTGEAGCDDIRLELHYEGKDTQRTDPAFTSDLSLDITCSTEPIDTHPNFLEFAGTRTDPKNGAKFDPRDGRFLFFQAEWPEDSGKLNPLAGVRSYNVPVMVASQTRIDTEWPDSNEIALVGKIIESRTLDANIPGLSNERNWLFTGMRIRSIGNVYYEVTRTAALSGPRKWVEEIYDPIKSAPSS